MTKKTKKPAPASKTKAPPLEAKKAKQLGLGEGFDRKKIAEIEKAAEAYRAVRDKRMELGKAEREKKKLLVDVVQKNGVSKYIYEGDDGRELEVDLKSKTNVTVRLVKDDDDEGDEAEE
jgi:hypothetical protein